jgi:hypothetical protein
MDARFNPLRHIPDPSLQTYFTIVLFSMWSAFFALIAAYWGGWLGNYSIVWSIGIHAAIIIPISFTNAVFIDAERSGAQWVQQWQEERNLWKWWKNRKNEVRIKWDLDKEA